MAMLSVCSATPSCSSHFQISFHGGQRLFSPSRNLEVRCIAEDRIVLGLSDGTHLQGVSSNVQATKSLFSSFAESPEQSGSMDFIDINSCPEVLDDIQCRFSNKWSSSMGSITETYPMIMRDQYTESSIVSASEEELTDFSAQLTEDTNFVSGPADPDMMPTMDVNPDNPTSIFEASDVGNESLSRWKTNMENSFAGVNEFISTSVNKGENALKSSLDTITSSITSAITSATEAVDNAVNEVLPAVDLTRESSGSRLESFSNDVKEATNKVGVIAVDVLRHTVVALEDSLTNGANVVIYAYGSAKELLPPEIENGLNLAEGRAMEALNPIGTALQQVYIYIEGLERSLGLDPSDPIVPFALFLGTSATLWVFYLSLTYGGYSGDLSPKSTLELLLGKENVVLIDVRPEDLRERDGIPDLRRAARSRYASVTLPELDGSIRKLLKSGRDLDDILIASVIRSLKIVQDRSKVIVMDADGTRSKGIARSLRKLGVKRPYLVQGGFRSWGKQGLRIKELKPETALTILNEEAEAILEDISLTPAQVLVYGVGFIAAVYALLEWEKALQFIGVIGIGQTIYRRVSSYEDTEDFNRDVRLLLGPVKLGSRAFSWAAGKLETNRIGLPTSPSSPDVQIRVLQAAAKHESQPSDSEEIQDQSPESTSLVNENVDLSEA